MGFQKPNRTVNLVFEDEYEGLEIATKAASVKTMLTIQKLQSMENNEGIPELITLLTSHIKSWNLEDEGVSVPVSEGVLSELEPDMFLSILSSWATATAGVAVPLAENSESGEISQVDLIPTETL